MKILIILCFALSSSFSLANEEALKRLDALFDLRVKQNEKYRDEYSADAEELENKEAREFLVKSEKTNGQLWIDFTKRMKTNPDITARVQFIRLEIVGEIHTAYFDLEYAEGLREELAARGSIVKWKKQLKELDAVAALLKKAPATKE